MGWLCEGYEGAFLLSKRWSSHAQSLRKKKEEDRSKLLVKEWKRNWIVPSHGNGEGSAVEGDKRN